MDDFHAISKSEHFNYKGERYERVEEYPMYDRDPEWYKVDFLGHRSYLTDEEIEQLETLYQEYQTQIT